MKNLFLKFVMRALILTIALVLISLLCMYYFPPEFVTTPLPFLPVFFFGATIMVHYILLKSIEKRFALFMNTFLLATMIKLVFFMAVMIIYAFVRRGEAVSFIISFFCLYVIYTFFEIMAISSYKKHE